MANEQAKAERKAEPQGAMVVKNLVKVEVPDSIVNELLDEGIVGLLDYGIEYSFNPDEISDDNPLGRGVLSNMPEFSRVGGYVLTRTPKSERIIVGRASPSCIRFEKIQNGTDVVLKCVELDAYADVTDEGFDGLHDVIEERPRSVFNPIGNSDHRERVVSVVTQLERNGKIQR